MTTSQEAREYPPPLVKVLAEWEDENGTLAGITMEEWVALYNDATKAAVQQSPRQLRALISDLRRFCIDADRKARQQEALDARRYRWLRDGAMTSHHSQATRIAARMYGFEWDAAIDAAIAKGEQSHE